MANEYKEIGMQINSKNFDLNTFMARFGLHFPLALIRLNWSLEPQKILTHYPQAELWKSQTIS